jgi:8-oxo-dGTP pyrophosphatase MutT (NUDIX family)
MTTKIYFNNKPLFITSELTAEIEEYLHHEETVYIDDYNIHTVKAMIHEMELPKIRAGVFLHPDAEAVLKAFIRKLHLVKAAGGFVHNPDGDVLLIHRRGKWDLPKGKLDEGETLETCAVREIREETGLQQLKLSGPLTVTYHTYHEFTRHILKESHWYLVSTGSNSTLVPQLEEDIDKCEWVKPENLAIYMDNMHASLLDVVRAGVKALHEVKDI